MNRTVKHRSFFLVKLNITAIILLSLFLVITRNPF